MQMHSSDARVQSAACAALQSLALNQDNHLLIWGFGGADLVVSAMKASPKNATLQSLGCFVLMKLADKEGWRNKTTGILMVTSEDRSFMHSRVLLGFCTLLFAWVTFALEAKATQTDVQSASLKQERHFESGFLQNSFAANPRIVYNETNDVATIRRYSTQKMETVHRFACECQCTRDPCSCINAGASPIHPECQRSVIFGSSSVQFTCGFLFAAKRWERDPMTLGPKWSVAAGWLAKSSTAH